MIYKELNKFNHIVFKDDDHTYKLNEKQLTSVTTFIGKFKKPFEKEFWSYKKAEQEGVTQQDILDKWDEIALYATNKGSKLHNFAENYINNKIIDNVIYEPLDIDAYDTIESHFLKFYEDTKDTLIPITSELVVGSEELGLCGMVDQLYFSTKLDALVIFDWKTNKRLTKKSRFQNKMLGPCAHLDECEMSTYSLQLSTYRYIIEHETNLKFHSTFIVWFNERNKSYELVPCEDYRNLVKEMLNYN